MIISLVIPVKNEERSLENLFASINRQTLKPDEIVLVDGGSTDKTVEIAERTAIENTNLKLIKTAQATPGKGRNIGVENAAGDWIAFTDAGIKLQKNWLENLVRKADEADVVYGNYAPQITGYFEKIAAIVYVPALRKDFIRGKSIASCLIKKKVWETVGGFPDLRAAEDLMFMESAEKAGFKCTYAPDALVYWQLRQNWSETFRKFVLYSKFNVWANRQWDWHYGILKQYLVVLPFVLLMIFHSVWWATGIVLWLGARTAKRILAHRFEFGFAPLFNPLYFFGVMFLILTIDAATFVGWAQAYIHRNER